jgi:hypothetical protein
MGHMGRKLGELLVAEGRISEAVLSRALEIQGTQARGLRLGAILLRWGLVPEKALLETLARAHRCPAVDWATLSTASQDAVNLLTAAQSKRLAAVPYAADKKSVRVAFANPSDLPAIDEVASITRRRVIVMVTTEVRLLQAQQRFYQRPLPRDVWTILQKIEHPASVRSVAAPKLGPRPAPLRPSRPAPSVVPKLEPQAMPPPELVPPSLWTAATAEAQREIETCPYPASESVAEPVSEDSLRVESVVEDLVEPAPPPAESLPVAVESTDEQKVSALRADDAEAAEGFELVRLEELFGERVDPFADETPLTDFIEQALAFYETQPAFRSALNALDDGAVEDLEIEAEEMAIPPEPAPPAPEAPSTASSFDVTHPSLRREQRSEVGPEAAV